MAGRGMIQWLQPGDAIPKQPKPEKADASGWQEPEAPAEEPEAPSEEETHGEEEPDGQ
jgi:hypothetical protein